jgi:hypothetical protein
MCRSPAQEIQIYVATVCRCAPFLYTCVVAFPASVSVSPSSMQTSPLLVVAFIWAVTAPDVGRTHRNYRAKRGYRPIRDNRFSWWFNSYLTPTPSVVRQVAGDRDLSTLLAALVTAGLTDNIDDRGPYTVFAPVDAAFAGLPSGQLAALLADRAALKTVLVRHVVAGRILVGKDDWLRLVYNVFKIRNNARFLVRDFPGSTLYTPNFLTNAISGFFRIRKIIRIFR